MTYDDREDFCRLYQAYRRASWLSCLGGLWISAEVVLRDGSFRRMATGWRFCSWLGLGFGVKALFDWHNGQTYAPLMGAYLRKYHGVTVTDRFELTDRKREYYEIDTSQFMSYTGEGLHSHFSHGPQPDDESADGSWLRELDAFLNNKPNALKEH